MGPGLHHELAVFSPKGSSSSARLLHRQDTGLSVGTPSSAPITSDVPSLVGLTNKHSEFYYMSSFAYIENMETKFRNMMFHEVAISTDILKAAVKHLNNGTLTSKDACRRALYVHFAVTLGCAKPLVAENFSYISKRLKAGIAVYSFAASDSAWIDSLVMVELNKVVCHLKSWNYSIICIFRSIHWDVPNDEFFVKIQDQRMIVYKDHGMTSYSRMFKFATGEPTNAHLIPTLVEEMARFVANYRAIKTRLGNTFPFAFILQYKGLEPLFVKSYPNLYYCAEHATTGPKNNFKYKKDIELCMNEEALKQHAQKLICPDDPIRATKNTADAIKALTGKSIHEKFDIREEGDFIMPTIPEPPPLYNTSSVNQEEPKAGPSSKRRRTTSEDSDSDTSVQEEGK